MMAGRTDDPRVVLLVASMVDKWAYSAAADSAVQMATWTAALTVE